MDDAKQTGSEDGESNAPTENSDSNEQTLRRCPNCDTVNAAQADSCIGCSTALEPVAQNADATARTPSERELALGIVDESKSDTDSTIALSKDRSGKDFDLGGLILKIATLLVVAAAIWTAFDLQRSRQVSAEIIPTLTITQLSEVAAAPAVETRSTLTPTSTPIPTEPPTLTPEPTATPTIPPTPTLQAPYEHLITEGEALFNIALRYAVSVESIIDVNPGLSPERIVSGSTINVPRPTATPPLVPVLLEIGDDMITADPDDCVQHVIEQADTLFGIARLYSVPIEALLSMNRLSAESLLNPGDTVCIPTIIYSVGALPEEVGELGGERAIIQPQLLYPPDNALLEGQLDVITLQWIAERNLEAGEWYMIEVTNLSAADGRPQRAFSRNTSFQVPGEWREGDSAENTYRWRISYVRVRGERGDGAFLYAFGGPNSESTFTVQP